MLKVKEIQNFPCSGYSRRKAKNLKSCLQNDQGEWISDFHNLANQVASHFRSIYVEEKLKSMEDLISSLASICKSSLSLRV